MAYERGPSPADQPAAEVKVKPSWRDGFSCFGRVETKIDQILLSKLTVGHCAFFNLI